MKNLVILLVLIIGGCKLAKEVRQNFVGYQKEHVDLNYESKVGDSTFLIKRSDSNLVILSFYGQFNDTLAMYVNNVESQKFYVKSADSNTSSAYTGKDVGI